MDKPDLKVELRLKNVVYKCGLEDKFYNILLMPAYAVGFFKQLAPDSAGNIQMAITDLIICENCYNDNKGKGLMFKDPSKIIIPEMKAPSLKNLVNREGVN